MVASPFLLYKRGCKFREILSLRILTTHEIYIIIYYSEECSQFQSLYYQYVDFVVFSVHLRQGQNAVLPLTMVVMWPNALRKSSL